jgi:molecular chaperone DnaJ
MPGQGGGQGGFGFDLGDIFGNQPNSTGGRLGDLLGGVFGNRTGTQARPRRGADIETETSLTFGDAIDGVTVSLRLAGEGPCGSCAGTGAKAGTVPRVCPTCEGTGQASGTWALRAVRAVQDLPGPRAGGRRPVPGVLGQRRAMSTRPSRRASRPGSATAADQAQGQGRARRRGGPAGTCTCGHVAAHPVFGRSGYNLTSPSR